MAARRLLAPLLKLNLYVDSRTRNSTDVQVIHDQIVSTRVYIVLVTKILLIITLFTALRPVMITEVVLKPSLDTYLQLEAAHASRLSCLCRQSTVKYASFFTIKPVYHDVSDFEVQNTEFLFGDRQYLHNDSTCTRYAQADLYRPNGSSPYSTNTRRVSLLLTSV